jgi:ribonuclease BN (tRNA processing enzyme)
VLGCAGTFPAPGAACSGYLLEAAPAAGQPGVPTRVWVDAGAGTLANLLRQVPVAALDAIWISHLHADHLSDLPLAGHALCFGPRPAAAPIPLFGPPGLEAFLRSALPDGVPTALATAFELHELHDGDRFGVGALELEAVATDHGLPTFGLRASGDGGTVAYSADSGPSDALGRLARDADLFLCEATWARRPAGIPPIHLTPTEAGRLAAGARAKRLLLTHLRPDTDPGRTLAEARDAYGGWAALAVEGAVHELPGPARPGEA